MSDILISDLTREEQVALFTNPTRKPIVELRWVNSSNIVYKIVSGKVLSGSLKVQLQSGQRRSVGFSMINDDENLIPTDEDSDIWFDKTVRLFTGLIVGSDRYIEQQGVFLFGNPSFDSDSSTNIVNIQLYDKFATIDGTLNGITRYGYEVPASSNIGSAIRAIFTEANESVSPIINPVLDTKTTPFSIRTGFGETYGSILLEMAEAYSQTVYYDQAGIPRFEDQPKQNNIGSVWDFTIEDNIMLGMNHSYDLVNMKNAIQVYSANSSNATLVKGYAQDDDILSPTFVGKIGTVLDVIEDDAIPDNTLAQLRADYELLKNKEVFESITLQCVPINIIKEGDIVTVTNPHTGANRERFMVIGIDFPMDFDGTMNLSLSKARTVQDIVLL